MYILGEMTQLCKVEGTPCICIQSTSEEASEFCSLLGVDAMQGGDETIDSRAEIQEHNLDTTSDELLEPSDVTLREVQPAEVTKRNLENTSDLLAELSELEKESEESEPVQVQPAEVTKRHRHLENTNDLLAEISELEKESEESEPVQVKKRLGCNRNTRSRSKALAQL